MGRQRTAEEKLVIEFRKHVHKDYCNNAELDPAVPTAIKAHLQPQERVRARVDSKQSDIYWFSDRRLLREDEIGVRELFRYQDNFQAHWMFKDALRKSLHTPGGPAAMKRAHSDRIEVELPDRTVGLEAEGLGSAYVPVLNFLWWIKRPPC